MIQFVDLLSSAGVAALVSAILTYAFKSVLEAKIKKSLASDMESIKASHAEELEYVRELIQRNAEIYPTLVESVYRCRNIARELERDAFTYDDVLRSELGTQALALTEGLYRARLFLSPDVFRPLHQFKRVLEQFVFDYDLLTGPNPSEGVRAGLHTARERLDSLYDESVESAQEVLRVGSERGIA